MNNIFKNYFDIKEYTREEKRRRKIKFYYIGSIVLWTILMLIMILGPVVDRYSTNNNTNVAIKPVVIIPQKEEEPEVKVEEIYIDQVYAEMLAKLAWGEARGCTKTEQAAVMWCVLNRVDSDNPDFRDTIATVITQPNQFHYKGTFPLEEDLLELAYDVLTRWSIENETGEIDGRVLPREYCWFRGDGKRNWFRDAYKFEDANIWDWSLESPYEDGV